MPIGSPPDPHADGADPSMEEILASIRKILNEDDSAVGPAAKPAQPASPDDVLVLDESMMVSAPAEAAPREAAVARVPPAEIAADTPAVEFAREHATSDRATALGADPVQSDLIAPEAAAAAASSLGSLVRTLSSGRSSSPQVYSGGPTLEDMVRAELRPALQGWLDTNLAQTVETLVRAELRVSVKGWLDANLPGIVERLVRAEIERVVRRAVP